MSKVTIYHNPRCSKSRDTLKLLQGEGIDPVIVEYLKEPPSAAQLKKIIKMLKVEPRDIMRKKEAEYKKLKLDNPKLTQSDLIEAMVKHPVLIERPIVLANQKAAMGRPPESVLEIL